MQIVLNWSFRRYYKDGGYLTCVFPWPVVAGVKPTRVGVSGAKRIVDRLRRSRSRRRPCRRAIYQRRDLRRPDGVWSHQAAVVDHRSVISVENAFATHLAVVKSNLLH